MRCPVDDNELRMTDRAGVEIDYCPECRGVWLDRGELDKIIDRAGSEPSGPPERVERTERTDRPERAAEPGRRKKRNWLGEIFELGE